MKYSSRITAQVFRYLELGLLVLLDVQAQESLAQVLVFCLSDGEKWRAIKIARMNTLMRMSEARQTVTLLGRLLAPKNEVLEEEAREFCLLKAHLSDVQRGS